MKVIWKHIRPYIRSLYRILSALNGFLYDFLRFVRYGGWKENINEIHIRNYSIAMAYHGLEKSLSYKNRNPESGWSNAERVFNKLLVAERTGDYGYHDKAAKQVLQKFLNLPLNSTKERAKKMLSVIGDMKFDSKEVHGSISLTSLDYSKGQLQSPEDFFLSRYSLREFDEQRKVDLADIKRAIRLAMKTPSVCNRQEWHVYHTDNPVVIRTALNYQNGNKPFGNKAQNLLIITVDLKAFFTGPEHYQHWIDGGLFSMSLMYAFHSLGIASCPLNWSQTPKRDKQLRKAVRLKNNHTVMMMMIVGYPSQSNKVCSSSRKPLEEIFSNLETNENSNNNNPSRS